MPRPALPNAHPTALISDEAVLPPDVKVGPFAIIEGPVAVGSGCVIGPHAHLTGPLTIGANNQIGTGVILGAAPQHLGYKGEVTALEIGDGFKRSVDAGKPQVGHWVEIAKRAKNGQPDLVARDLGGAAGADTWMRGCGFTTGFSSTGAGGGVSTCGAGGHTKSSPGCM